MNLLFTITFFCRPAFAAAPLLLLSFLSLTAQPSDTIVPNPKAVTLHNIWKVTGKEEQDMVGILAGSLGDISGDTLGDFAVADSRSNSWKIYLGGRPVPDTTPDWMFADPSGSLSYPVVGNFLGTGQKIVAFAKDTCNENHICFFRLFFFRVVDGILESTPFAELNTGLQFCPRDVIAADLDKDGADELILSRSCSFPEIWIYKGGLNFLKDGEPTLVIADQDYNSFSAYSLHVIDADNDTYPDLLVDADYDNAPKFKVWYGSAGSPWNWGNSPDRVLSLLGTGLNLRPVVADFDGDHVPDIAATLYGGDTAGIYVYRSGSGKDFRTRSFAREDADNIVRTNTSLYRAFGSGTGYLNDSSRTYATLPLIFTGFDRFDNSEMLLLSGGKNGPNATFDARYRPDLDGISAGRIFRHMSPLPDCNGDGWDDVLTANDDWYGYDHGIALVLAGGPEIPNDDPTVSVREEPVAGESGGLYLWPNPVKDELNIAWKGNLRRMPARFAVHDMTGKRVASGQVEPSVGAAVWRCGELAAGTYLLTAFDAEENVIAVTEAVKE